MLTGTAFARYGPQRLQKDPENRHQPIFTKRRSLLQRPRASVHDPAAFGPKAHMTMRSILGPTRLLPRTAFAQHGLGRHRVVSPNTVRGHNVPITSVDDPAAFGPKTHRPPRSILGHARMLSGTAFAWHGPQGLWRVPENPQEPSVTKCHPLRRHTGHIRR